MDDGKEVNEKGEKKGIIDKTEIQREEGRRVKEIGKMGRSKGKKSEKKRKGKC